MSLLLTPIYYVSITKDYVNNCEKFCITKFVTFQNT